ncbi:MAG TPA: ABC transporter permease, partial [Microlunatus sp.]|nr:ABC transporter permease [Microlunatus sp.]
MSVVGELSALSRRKKGTQKDETPDNKVAYLFLAPWLLGLFGITIGPMVASLVLSFTDYNLIQPPQWVGLENFVAMANDARLMNSLRVTFTYVVVSVPLQL